MYSLRQIRELDTLGFDQSDPLTEKISSKHVCGFVYHISFPFQFSGSFESDF